jgi:hypothetical protein
MRRKFLIAQYKIIKSSISELILKKNTAQFYSAMVLKF